MVKLLFELNLRSKNERNLYPFQTNRLTKKIKTIEKFCQKKNFEKNMKKWLDKLESWVDKRIF